MKILKSLKNSFEKFLDGRGLAYGILMIWLSFAVSFFTIGVIIPLIGA